MKKLITSIILTLAGVSAFAISQEQIVAANAICESSDIPINDATIQAFEPFAVLAASDIAEYLEVRKNANNGGRWDYCVGKVAKTKGFETGEDFDTITTGGSVLHHWANESIENYNALKARDFKSVGGYKMAEYRILMLTVKSHSDPEAALKYVSEVELAKNFDNLLLSVRKAKLEAENNYKILSQIAQTFAQYRDTIEAVKNNWEALQNDKNEAFMAYYADSKLKSLTK